MTKRLATLPPAAALALLALTGEARPESGSVMTAITVVERYSNAFSRFDCDGLLRDIAPRVRQSIDRQGGVAGLCETIASFAKQGVKEELIREMRTASSGPYRLALFPNRRTYVDTVRRKKVVTEGTYVVHSNDSGQTWHVLDVSCVDEKWIRVLYPPYDGTPRIAPAQLRVEDHRN